MSDQVGVDLVDWLQWMDGLNGLNERPITIRNSRT